jgi:hypothetical protein
MLNFRKWPWCKLSVGLIFTFLLIFFAPIKDPLEAIYYFISDRAFRGEMQYEINKAFIPKTSVVLFDQSEVGEEKFYKKTPIDYADHANLLIKLCAMNPKAIMYDMHFIEGTRDDSDLLINAFKYASESCSNKSIPIILSKPENVDVFIPESESIKYGSVDIKLNFFGAVSGYKHPEEAAAAILYEEINHGKKVEEPEGLVWPIKNDNILDHLLTAFYPAHFYDITKDFPTNIFNSHQIIQNTDASIENYVKDSVVFIGANFVASNDLVTSNTYGSEVPGVFFHVMAFMNYYMNPTTLPKSTPLKIILALSSVFLFVCLFPMLVTWSFNRSNGIKVVKKNISLSLHNYFLRKNEKYIVLISSLHWIYKNIFKVFFVVFYELLKFTAWLGGFSLFMWCLSSLGIEFILPYVVFIIMFFLITYPWYIKCEEE